MAYQKVKLDGTMDTELNSDLNKFSKENTSSDFAEGVPVAFLNDAGKYKFRIYPELHKGRVRVFRTAVFHMMNFPNPATGSPMKIKCVSDTRLQKALSNYDDSSIKDIFKYKAKNYSMFLAKVYEAPADSQFIKPDTTVVLIVKPRIMAEISKLLTELNPTDRMQLLDQDAPSPAIVLELETKMSKDGNSSWTAVKSCTLDTKQVELGDPVFSETTEYEGLDKVYIPEDQVITEKELNLLMMHLDKEQQKTASYIDATSADGFSTSSSSNENDMWDTPASNPTAITDEIPF